MNEPQIFRIEIENRLDGQGETNLVAAAQQLGLLNLTACHIQRLFFIAGSLSLSDVQKLAQELLADPVTETFTVTLFAEKQQICLPEKFKHTVEVTLLPGVTDPIAENLMRAAALLGQTALERAATGQRYLLQGNLSEEELKRLATEVFSNPVIQRFTLNQAISPPFIPFQQKDETVESIALRSANAEQLVQISKERRLALDLAEMQAIQTYFQNEKREPTDLELETLAQTWSEHCVHKTFAAKITCSGAETQEINSLLNSYIRAATEKVAKPWVRSAFVDNAGIIAFDEHWDLAFKVETHNHPSALEPFGGANTGVGGVVRDVLGVSARPIANTDVLCFGPPDLAEEDLPKGVLHPRRIAAGVIHGVEDYGNKMGIPTVNGAILYHPGYTANPLVFCGCLGLLPKDSHPFVPQPGDLVIVLGGRTGRDGLRGATFSSMEMDQTTSEIAGSAVQIGHPIHEKQALEVVLRARDAKLYHAITDCGAGGLSSAVGEMGKKLGVKVQLEAVPLKYPGLRPWEIWLSEAQERMVLAVAPESWPQLQALCQEQEVEAVSIGTFENTARLQVFSENHLVGDLEMAFLHDGIPQRHLQATLSPSPKPAQTSFLHSVPANLTDSLLKLLAHPNIRSKEAVIRRYDHEVQGATAVKPLVGVANHGPSDAAVLVPLETLNDKQQIRGVALANGICPLYGERDSYAMAWAAIDEAMRNIVAVGGDPDQVALLDNFCWGNPNLPDRLGSLVRSVQGCYDAAIAYNAPFISGKDSLNNEYTGADGQKHAIPGTLLISAVGIVPDVQQAVTMDLKQPANKLYLIGDTKGDLGGSHYALMINEDCETPPQPGPNALKTLRTLHQAIITGLVKSCHDCSEGGIGVALAEMCLAGRLGAEVKLASLPQSANFSDDILLFTESLTRFIVEVAPEQSDLFEKHFVDLPFAQIGEVKASKELHVWGRKGNEIVKIKVVALEKAWRGEEAKVEKPNLHSRSFSAAQYLAQQPKVLILHVTGTNRDREAALACELAGGKAEIVHLNQLLAGERKLLDYQMLVLPGGFSYGDDLGAGTLWALDINHRLGNDLKQFVALGKPVLGICNGFQALVKAGLLPGKPEKTLRTATLAPNDSAHFECRWVYLQPNPQSPSLFTKDLTELIYCPVAHGEGKFIISDADLLKNSETANFIALRYVNADGTEALYPANPNGSSLGIAGICNSAGNVLGLMPHPEDHIFFWQHPRWQRGEVGMLGLQLFKNGLKYG